VAIDDEGRVSFMDLMRNRSYLAFAAFDLLWLNGRDLRQLPLIQRKKRLDRLIPVTTGTLLRIPCFEEHGRDLFEAACRLTWRESWPNAWLTPTARGPPGTRSRIRSTRRLRAGGNSLRSIAELASHVRAGSERTTGGDGRTLGQLCPKVRNASPLGDCYDF
jgi:hypothetical protein